MTLLTSNVLRLVWSLNPYVTSAFSKSASFACLVTMLIAPRSKRPAAPAGTSELQFPVRSPNLLPISTRA